MKAGSAGKIKLASYDDLFGTQLQKESSEGEILRISLDKLQPFKNHPFQVVDDERMMDTVDSVKKYGVLVPGIVRMVNKEEYEIIAGHRRKRASELAGCQDMPVIIRYLSDDEATIVMVDSNIQRECILISEKSWAYRMKMEALSHQGLKGDKFTADVVGETSGDSGRTVQRYIRLTYLKTELLGAVDLKKLSHEAGIKLSYLSEEEQGWILKIAEDAGIYPSGVQSETLRELSEQGKLTYEQVYGLLKKQKRIASLTLPAKKIRNYFLADYTKEHMESIIFSLLEEWKEKQDHGCIDTE